MLKKYIKEEKDVFVFVDELINYTKHADGGDPFWEKSETLLLNALILYIRHECEEKDQTLSKVLQLLTMEKIDESNPSAKSPLDIMFGELEKKAPDSLAITQYRLFKQAGCGSVLKSILRSSTIHVKEFMNK